MKAQPNKKVLEDRISELENTIRMLQESGQGPAKHDDKNISPGLVSDLSFKTFADVSPNMIFIYCGGKIIYANPACEKISKYSIAELSSDAFSFVELTAPEYRELIAEKLKIHMSGKDVEPYEYSILTKDGKKLYTVLSTKLFKYGNDLAIMGIITDITERKKMEVALRESEELLREVNAAKDKFFSILAHDLKSPFNSILGFSQLLKQEVKNLDVATIDQYANMINSVALQTYRLLEDLLEWASALRGNINYTPSPVILNEVFVQQIESLRGMAAGKEITLTNGLSEHIILVTDRNILCTIIRNLINNAIKFTHKKGWVELSALEYKNNIEISVADNGTGMKKDFVDNLFKIEVNQSKRGTENEAGTGLGLLLCREFVDKLGGRIWVESEAGKGSVFHFTVPVSKRSVRRNAD